MGNYDMNIVFVCTGNTCRSPMAMGIFNMLADREGLAAHAKSCGVAAFASPASENAVIAARRLGADISNHISCSVDENMIKTADRVYGMTHRHVQTLRSAYPQYADKIFPVAKQDIPDPYGGNRAEYEEIAQKIYDAVEKIIRRIKEASLIED